MGAGEEFAEHLSRVYQLLFSPTLDLTRYFLHSLNLPSVK